MRDDGVPSPPARSFLTLPSHWDITHKHAHTQLEHSAASLKCQFRLQRWALTRGPLSNNEFSCLCEGKRPRCADMTRDLHVQWKPDLLGGTFREGGGGRGGAERERDFVSQTSALIISCSFLLFCTKRCRILVKAPPWGLAGNESQIKVSSPTSCRFQLVFCPHLSQLRVDRTDRRSRCVSPCSARLVCERGNSCSSASQNESC